ncbi:MAG: tetratricopeptide repeat protein [Nitrospirae bacterium]|nr:tetratricopeptide repeat protein [Nitrospirota bacterium]
MYIKFRIHDTKKMHDAGYTIQDKENPTACIMDRESCIVSRASCIMYLASLFSAVLAMKTKEIAFTLPFVIILYEFSFFGKAKNYELQSTNSGRFLYLLPFLFVLILIPLSLIGPGFTIDTSVIDAGEEIRYLQLKEAITLPRYAYLFTQLRVIATYIRLLFLPINQNLDYDYPVYSSFLEPAVILSFLFLLAIFGFGIYLWVKGLKVQRAEGSNSQLSTVNPLNFKLIPFGILWFFITLSVESSIIPIKDVIFEHRVYLPSVGIIMAFGTALFGVIQRRGSSATVRQNDRTSGQSSSFSFLSIALPLYCPVALIVLLSIAAYQRNSVWQDKVRLWEDVVSNSPNKTRGHYNLGDAYCSRGWIDRAIEHYQITLKLKPDHAGANTNLGFLYYYSKGWIDKAIEHYEIALRSEPGNARTHLNMGIAYKRKGQMDKAIIHFEMANRLNPSIYRANNIRTDLNMK